MAKLKNEMKRTFSTFMDSIRPEKQEERKPLNTIQKEDDVMKDSVNKKQAPSFDLRENAPNAVAGRSVPTASQSQKPNRAIYINKSSTVKVMEPKDKEDSFFVIEELKNEQTVMVKLNSVEPEVKKQILDHIYGACAYANLKVEKIDTQMILIDPSFN